MSPPIDAHAESVRIGIRAGMMYLTQQIPADSTVESLIASLPLVSVLGMIWLWRDTRDPERMAIHAGATFWYVLPSLPMFLLIPAMLKRGAPFWVALGAGCGLTIALYLMMTWIGPRLGLRL